MAPKRKLSAVATTVIQDDVRVAETTKRPKRAAAEAAMTTLKEQIAYENAGESSALAFAASSSASSRSSGAGGISSKGSSAKAGVLKYGTPDTSGTVTSSRLSSVPAEILDVQAPGVLRTPELYTAPPPTRDAAGVLRFKDAPSFTPNMTPAEVLQAGSFGGYYYRAIASGVTGKVHVDAWREFPESWFVGLKPAYHLSSPMKDPSRNRYKVDCGQDLRAWEESGWISEQDPFGWFQWYCRFYLGRRSADDERQIGRWVGVAGAKGRWKTNLIHKVVLANASYDDASVSPVVRQTLQHWAYTLTKEDYNAYAKQVKAGKTTSFIRS